MRAAGEGAWTVMQLATVKPDGRPSNRNLVYRGFLDGRDAIVFFGDRRCAACGSARSALWGACRLRGAACGAQARRPAQAARVDPGSPASPVPTQRVPTARGLRVARALACLPAGART